MIAEVIIDTNVKSLNKSFDYLVPKNLEATAKIGTRVFVPFGKQLKEGYIINIKEESSFKVKEIVRFEQVPISQNKVKLAILMARRYFCNISDCMKLMLPPGVVKNKVKEKVRTICIPT